MTQLFETSKDSHILKNPNEAVLVNFALDNKILDNAVFQTL